MKRFLSILLVLVLSTLLLAACTPAPDGDVSATGADLDIELPDNPEKGNEILGQEGNIKFTFTVTHADGSKVQFNVETTKDNLGDALLEGNIIKGDDGEFGLYVTEVDGEKAIWEEDQSYWYFYKDGEALMTGVSTTPVANGDNFEAKYTK